MQPSPIALGRSEKTDFLLVAGDVYDGADRSLQAQLRFRQGLRKLDEAGIRVYLVHGNHDPLDGWSDSLDVGGIRRLQLGRESYESARRDLPGVQKQCKTRLDQLLDTLRRIGVDWSEERLKAFDTSLAVQEEVSAHQKHLSDLQSEYGEATRRVRDVEQAFSEAKADLVRAEDVLSVMSEPEAKDEAKLAERKRVLRASRSQLTDVHQRKARLAHLEERHQDMEMQAERLRGDLEEGSIGFSGWVAPMLLVAGVAGLLGLGIGRGDWLSGGVVLGVSVAATVLLMVGRRTSSEGAKRKRADRAEEVRGLDARSHALEQEIEELRQALADADSKIQEQLHSVGFATIPDGRTMDDAEAAVERQLEAWQRYRPAEQKRDEARATLAKAEEAMSRAREIDVGKTDELDRAQEEWRNWLRTAGLPETLTPESAISVLARLDSAREQLKAIATDRERIAQMTEAIREYDEQVQSVAETSDLGSAIPGETGAAVEFLSECLREHEEMIRALEGASRRQEEARKQTARAESKAEEAERSYRAALTEEEQHQHRWRDLLERFGLRSSLAVENAPQMLQAIDRARDHLSRVDEARKQVRSSRETMESYCQDVRSVAKAAGRSEPIADDVAKAVSALIAELDAAEENRRQAENLKNRIGEFEGRIDLLQGQVEQRQKDVDELLEAAGATDEEMFRQRAADHESRGKLEDQIRHLETRLRQLAGSGNALDTLKEELTQVTPEELNVEQNELADTMENKEQELVDALDERGRLRSQLEQLERSEELSRLRIEEQAARAQFEAGAREWSVLKIAAHLIDRAREKYERERRPAVLKQAERYFTHFTGGRYTEIRAPSGGHQLIVLAPDGSTKEIGQLSRGTAEQLYLSLRFGFVQEFVGRSESLPLVFDDILVNFDPDRARATAEAIVDLSKSLQIVLFTCHPSTVDIMRGVESSIPVYAFKDGQLGLLDPALRFPQPQLSS